MRRYALTPSKIGAKAAGIGPVREATPPTTIRELVTPSTLPACETVGLAFPHPAATTTIAASTPSDLRDSARTYPLLPAPNATGSQLRTLSGQLTDLVGFAGTALFCWTAPPRRRMRAILARKLPPRIGAKSLGTAALAVP